MVDLSGRVANVFARLSASSGAIGTLAQPATSAAIRTPDAIVQRPSFMARLRISIHDHYAARVASRPWWWRARRARCTPAG
jgi:hypothetical protein